MTAVLLLNASYEPLKVISWQRAVTLFFLDKVEVIEEYDHEIRSISLVMKAPAVVRLLRYVKVSRRTPPLSRTNLLARDNFQCQYCQKALNSKTATLDHVLPKSRGGCSSWKNIVASCEQCNRKKGNKTPAEAGMALYKEPRTPDWLPVLRISTNGHIPKSWPNFLRSLSRHSRG